MALPGKWILAGIWAFCVVWGSSAFVHLLDADVNGIQGLRSPSVLASVTIVAALMLVPVLASLAAYRRRGWRALLVVVFAFAVLFGLLIGVLGYGGGPESTRLLAIAGFATLSGVVLLLATLPVIWVVRNGGGK